MNCEKARSWILLEQSGELSAMNSRRLARHLAVCTDCSRYRNDVLRLTRLATEHLPAEEPSEEAIHRILDSAEKVRPGRLIRYQWFAARAVAWAALFVAIVGGAILLMPEQPEKRAGPEHNLSAIMAVVDENPPEEYHSRDAASRLEIERELGRHLLRIEGLLDEDLMAEVLL